jgi:hypothetical protein
MRHQRSKVLRIARDRLLSRTRGKNLDLTQKRFGVVFGNCTIGARVVLVGPKGVQQKPGRSWVS